MQMTPMDIRNKEFRKGVRGYQCDEVKRFLEEVSQEFEIAYTENFELREKLQSLETQIGQYQLLEKTLQQTMVLAQQTAEDTKQTARREAELILREAEQEHTRKLSEAQKKWEEIQGEIQELMRKRELIRAQLKAFLNAHLELTETQDKISGS